MFLSFNNKNETCYNYQTNFISSYHLDYVLYITIKRQQTFRVSTSCDEKYFLVFKHKRTLNAVRSLYNQVRTIGGPQKINCRSTLLV
jgi:hypothetical protein